MKIPSADRPIKIYYQYCVYAGKLDAELDLRSPITVELLIVDNSNYIVHMF